MRILKCQMGHSNKSSWKLLLLPIAAMLNNNKVSREIVLNADVEVLQSSFYCTHSPSLEGI